MIKSIYQHYVLTVKVLALQKSLATVTDLILYMTLLDYQWCIGV